MFSGQTPEPTAEPSAEPTPEGEPTPEPEDPPYYGTTIGEFMQTAHEVSGK